MSAGASRARASFNRRRVVRRVFYRVSVAGVPRRRSRDSATLWGVENPTVGSWSVSESTDKPNLGGLVATRPLGGIHLRIVGLYTGNKGPAGAIGSRRQYG